MSTGFSLVAMRTYPGLFDLMTTSLAPLSTASFSRSLKISVWGVTRFMDRKALLWIL